LPAGDRLPLHLERATSSRAMMISPRLFFLAVACAGRHAVTAFVMPRIARSICKSAASSSCGPSVRMQAVAEEVERVPDAAECITPPETIALMEVVGAELMAKASSDTLSTTWRRAAFWEPGKCTLLEIINVLGRFESCSQWFERTEFCELDSKEERAEDGRNGLTKKRHEMALRMKCAERAALFQNLPDLPFTNEALAASVGLTVEDFERMPVTKEACEVTFDALAESRSSLIPYKVIDARRQAMVGENGFNEAAFRIGHTKSTVLFIIGIFLFGKANFLWVLVGVKLLHDWNPELIPGPKELGLFKIWGIV